MQKVFQCSSCGANNYLGTSKCKKCGIKFKYNCPRCGLEVSTEDNSCKKCGNYLFWNQLDLQKKEHSVKSKNKSDEKRSGNSWILPFVGMIIVILLMAAMIIYLLQMSERPSLVIVAENTSDNEIPQVIVPDIRPPVISGIEIITLSSDSVEIRWVTDEPSTSQVFYGLRGESLNPSEKKEALVRQHSALMTGLQLKSSYAYKIRSLDQFNNSAESDEYIFNNGKEPGISSVTVLVDSLYSEQTEYGVTRTVISGQIKNTGNISVAAKDIEAMIYFKVAGKSDPMEIKASIISYPEMIVPGELRKFSATMPNGTYPDYVISLRIIE